MCSQSNFDNSISFRLPIFLENKPYLYIKSRTETDDYRIALNNMFLKKYDLNFKIFRDSDINNILMNNIFVIDNKNTYKDYLIYKLPARHKLDVNKSTYILEYGKVDENDLIVDKYYIQQWNTTILITQRIINKISSNQSICIISNSDINTIIDKLSKFIRR